jgi:hypothetical protein
VKEGEKGGRGRERERERKTEIGKGSEGEGRRAIECNQNSLVCGLFMAGKKLKKKIL